MWDLKLAKSIQQIDMQKYIINESSDEGSKGISQFDFDKNSNRLLVHLHRFLFITLRDALAKKHAAS